MPGFNFTTGTSAKGVMFITIEDETGVANLVIWPSLYERQRRIILSAGMIAVQCRIQREGEVVHLVANQLTDLSAAGVGDRDNSLLPIAARSRRRIPPRQSRHRSAQPAFEGAEASGHLRAGAAHRQHQGEVTGFPISQLYRQSIWQR
jgi:DNA polymerase III alpha subunit